MSMEPQACIMYLHNVPHVMGQSRCSIIQLGHNNKEAQEDERPKTAWVRMIQSNRYLLKLQTDRIRLFFGMLFIPPGTRRYIEAIHAGLDRNGYERLALDIANGTEEFSALTAGMPKRAVAALTFDSLRALAPHRSYMHQLLTPYDDLKPAFDYFKGHIGYLDDKSDYGIHHQGATNLLY